MRRVTIGISMSESFIRLLDANVTISGLSQKDELDPVQQLALLVRNEARGGTEEQVHASILHTWRAEIEAVCKMREVVLESDYKPPKKQAVHWLFGLVPRKRTYCGSVITKNMETTQDKAKVSCQRCRQCMKLHDHLLEEATI